MVTSINNSRTSILMSQEIGTNPINDTNRWQKIDNTTIRYISIADISTSIISSMVMGMLGAVLIDNTGLSTAIHEYGHGLLGFRSVYLYAPGQGPSYWIQGWENFNKIRTSKTLQEKLKSSWQWLQGKSSSNANGAAGWTRSGTKLGLSPLGRLLGTKGSDAWVSLCGPLAELIFDLSLVASGIALAKEHPIIGTSILATGVSLHSIHLSYPASPLKISNSGIAWKSLTTGNDFTNFSQKMHEITGRSAREIAVLVATLWAVSLPIIGMIGMPRFDSDLLNLKIDELFNQSLCITSLIMSFTTIFMDFGLTEMAKGPSHLDILLYAWKKQVRIYQSWPTAILLIVMVLFNCWAFSTLSYLAISALSVSGVLLMLITSTLVRAIRLSLQMQANALISHSSHNNLQ